MQFSKSHVKTNIIYGLIFIVPVAIVLLLLAELVEVLDIIAKVLGFHSTTSTLVALIIACLFLLIFCFVIGTLVQTKLGGGSFRRFENTFLPLRLLFLFAGCVGGIGFSIVGMTPEGSGPKIGLAHGIGTGMAFIGLGSAAGLSCLIMLVRIIQKEAWPQPNQFFVLLALVLQIGIMIFFAKSPSIMQWTGFNSIFIWALGLFLIAPDEIQEMDIKS